ncbi:MAG: LuxR C-terminal-related transcriptional regulator, partial [Spirulinaceae cyanobacterium]
MIREQFERTFEQLTQRRREVLEKFLAGESDQEIAQDLYITKATVRQNISTICKKFHLINDFPDERRSQRSNLLALFAKYKPELVVSEKEKEIIRKTSDLSFVGREGAIADLDRLVKQGAKVILMYAGGGVGKTTLARRYLQQKFSHFIGFAIAKETQNITSVESLLEEKLKQLGEEPGREFGVSLERLKQKLKREKIGLLIDNLEPALDEKGKFVTPHRCYV